MTFHDETEERDPGLADDHPTLLNRRRALGLLGGAGLAAGLAAYGISLVSDDDQSKKRYFDVRDHGAAGDGVTDDTEAFQAAAAAARSVNGTVYLPPGTYGLSDEVQLLGVGQAATLMGAGPESSVVKALKADATVSWGDVPTGPGTTGQRRWGRPGTSRGWKFDGNEIATKGVLVGNTIGYGVWQNIHVVKCDGDGWQANPQNSTFIACISFGHSGHGWTIDYGAMANEFLNCHSYNNDGWDWEIRQSGGSGWGTYSHPQVLHFSGGIVEQGGSPYFADTGLGGVHIREGTDITFERFELVQQAGAGSLVLTPSTANGYVGRIIVRDCRVVGGIYLDAESGGVAHSMGGTNEPLLLTGWNYIDKIVNGSTATIYDDGVRPPDSYTTEGTGAATSLRRPPRRAT